MSVAIVVDIYLTASQFGKYQELATSTSVNNCFLETLEYLKSAIDD